MSGIYIPGMEMPTMPENIKQAEKVPYIDVRIFADGSAVTSKGERPYYTEYEAVPVPSHGRMVDADAIMARLNENGKRVFGVDGIPECSARSVVADYVESAPTIIPADKEGEG